MWFFERFLDKITGAEKSRLLGRIHDLEKRLQEAGEHQCEGKCAKRVISLVKMAGAEMLRDQGVGLGMKIEKDGEDFMLKNFKIVAESRFFVSAICKLLECDEDYFKRNLDIIWDKKVKDALTEKKVYSFDADFSATGGEFRLPKQHCGKCQKDKKR